LKPENSIYQKIIESGRAPCQATEILRRRSAKIGDANGVVAQSSEGGPGRPCKPWNQDASGDFGSSGAQIQAGDLRRAANPDGQQNFADAAADVDLSAIKPVPARDEALA
jgi:hypothetical protein